MCIFFHIEASLRFILISLKEEKLDFTFFYYSFYFSMFVMTID